MPSVSLVPTSASSWGLDLEPVGSANIHQVKTARYFEDETVTVYDPQRDGRFLWLEPPGKPLGVVILPIHPSLYVDSLV